jgi:hypothetical protein
MTAGYYLGGGIYVCWLHALFDRTIFRVVTKANLKMVALPKK